MKEGDVIINGINYGTLAEVEIAPQVWGIVADFKADLIKYRKRYEYHSEMFTTLYVCVSFNASQMYVYAEKREYLEDLARELSKQFDDVRVQGAARIFQTYKDGKPVGERKKYSDFYIVTPEEDAEYSW